jgi:maltose phosphorylase
MAKVADSYLGLDPWRVVEDGWDKARNAVSESVFSLGNEYMGVRGYFEEGCSAEGLLGSYFNGVYEEEKTPGTAYKGIVQKTHFMVNSVDWLHARISVNGKDLVPGVSKISAFRRALDFGTGTLTREYVWEIEPGKKLRISFLRLLDMEKPQQAFQKIAFTPEGFNGPVTVCLANDFNVIHAGRKKCFWHELRHDFFDSGAAILAMTESTGQKVFSGFSWESNRAVTPERRAESGLVGYAFELPLMDGEESFLVKKVYNLVEKKSASTADAVWLAGMEGCRAMSSRRLSDALESQERYWADVWARFDIRIAGDEKNQQGIRFCIFQMQQTYHGQDASNNIGAKGLTGEAYNGHAFWDTETYCLPFYLFTNMKAAKNLLEYRYSTLQQARARARDLDCRGACYPVATLNGDEACNLWQHASLQFQPSSAVAYGIAHYAHLSGDIDFLYGHGAEMLVEISRFLYSRGAWNQDRSGFGFYAVMGPDEFHMMVNNNCYTNVLGKKTFEYTLKVLSSIERERPELYRALAAKTGLTAGERNELSRAAEKMIVLFDPATGIYEQHEGYFSLPHIDVDKIPIEDFPLYHHWSYDRIYRTDMIKQPDVLMFMFLYDRDYPLEVKRANYEYYEPRTIHESSLSPSIHSVFASELGRHKEAFDFFGFATRMDLDNYNRNTHEGLHTTSIAAAWVNIVYGFGGMRSDGDILSFAPSLPAAWDEYEFGIEYRGARIRIAVSRSAVTFYATGASRPVPLEIYGTRHDLSDSPLVVALPQASRG